MSAGACHADQRSTREVVRGKRKRQSKQSTEQAAGPGDAAARAAKEASAAKFKVLHDELMAERQAALEAAAQVWDTKL